MMNVPEGSAVRLPRPRPWNEPVSAEQFQAFAPEGLELVDGYLLGGPEDGERRWNLLALLLTNIGLSLALSMADRDDLREAVEHRFGDLYPGAWTQHIRRMNQRVLGTSAELRHFLFGAERWGLSRYREVLEDKLGRRPAYSSVDRLTQ